jgi:hypothetical protein
MPQMSGFEFLSVVRRRFPEIPVLAVIGPYDSSDIIPGGIIADAFYAKGRKLPARTLAYCRRIDSNLGSTSGESPTTVSSSLDTTRKRLQGSAFHRIDLYGVPAGLSIESAASRAGGNTGNVLPFLRNLGEVHH